MATLKAILDRLPVGVRHGVLGALFGLSLNSNSGKAPVEVLAVAVAWSLMWGGGAAIREAADDAGSWTLERWAAPAALIFAGYSVVIGGIADDLSLGLAAGAALAAVSVVWGPWFAANHASSSSRRSRGH
ncbi:MAG TPA: hypothetical protein VER37_07355 [Thermomicrobiales bacterium]|nr:hypothetical protein [Thermomicrobiales bacterium]